MNKNIIKIKRIVILLSVGILPLMAKPHINAPSELSRIDGEKFDANRIVSDISNTGMIVDYHATGHSGMEWPAGAHTYSNFQSGVWFSGMVDGTIRTATAEYSTEFSPGEYDGDSALDEYQIYKVNKSDFADPLSSDDFQNWPAHRGAPWVDNDGNGVYSPLPEGPDHPEFIGDQVIFYTMTDGDASSHTLYNTSPLGIEVRVTMWGYNRPDAFGDMMFVKMQAYNKGGNEITDMFVGLWDDPDLGDAGDDWVGCDTELSLGYCYNDGPDNEYGDAAPALGYDFFQASVPSTDPTSTAFAFGETLTGYVDLPMSSFVKYINGDEVYYDPETSQEVYNYMSGLKADGSAFVNPATGLDSKFVHPCDPNDDTGPDDDCWVDGDADPSADRRFLMNVGPFAFPANDSLEVVFGILHAQASDALGSVALLKQVDQLAQLAYDIQFALPDSPPTPEVSATSSFEEIILSWGDTAESYTAVDEIDLLPVPVFWDTTWVTQINLNTSSDTTIIADDTTIVIDSTYTFTQIVDTVIVSYEGEPTTFSFEGYNVWQHENIGGTGGKALIATYDLINGITDIYDDIFDSNYGVSVNVPVQVGTDSGIKRWLSISNDKLNGGSSLINDREYYFSINAYGYNEYGLPKTLESADNIFGIRPQNNSLLTPQVEIEYSEFESTQTAGSADGSIAVSVINPYEVTGDSYEVFFTNKSDTTIAATDTTINTYIVWGVNNTTKSTTPVTDQPVQSGVDASDGSEVGVYSSPVFDGIQVTVSGPPNEYKDFYATHNAGGAIDGYAGAAADYYGYPGMGRDNIEAQQTNGSTWFITTSNGDNVDYADFYPYTTRYTGGYGNPSGGIQHLIPDDFEFRFTDTGGKMWDDENGVFIDVSMEVWNIGDASDSADDFQMMPMYFDPDANGVWDLAEDDHPISGGANDPYMESFYVLEHYLQEPGTTGYQAIIDALTADPTSNSASGGYIWASAPGYLGAAGQITSVTLLNMTFANWNGGDVEDATFPANVDAASPEVGTVFRMVTTKPNTTFDTFAFSTSSAVATENVFDCDGVNVWPNPYFGENVEEINAFDHQIHFTDLPETATISIYNLNGLLVKTLGHTMGQNEIWDMNNSFGIPVASGMYIAHVDTDGCQAVLKLAIVNSEQRLDRY